MTSSVYDSKLTHRLHSPEFKRLAAIQGDHTFHAGRRAAFSKWAATQDVWSFRSYPSFKRSQYADFELLLLLQVWKRRKDLLYIGSVHGGELPEMYGLTGDHVGTDAFSMHIPFSLCGFDR
jgi:hypothetical protein